MLTTKQTKQNSNFNPNQPLKLDSKLSKKRDRKELSNYSKRDRRKYSKQRYQAKKQEYHQWYLQRKAQQEQQEKEQTNKYYGAEAIKVLMSLKEYTELNQTKRKLWLDFIWTLKDLNQIEISNIVEVMRIRELANNLITDYWETAKKENKKGKFWNNLSEKQQQRLIKYWGQEKVRKETNLNEALAKQKNQGKNYEKEIELAKFHEERGKIKCPCYQCQESKRIQSEIKAEIFKESQAEKEQCPECNKWVKELEEESGVCRKCTEKYE